MNFFKRIFFKKVPENERYQQAEHKLNQFVSPRDPIKVYGGFYMIKDACITCGAPEAEAPDLIEHANGGSGECYFKKQPETEEEVSRAMNAVMVSCIDALRYGGKDEAILKRMYEMGLGHNCDYNPANTYAEVTRKIVTFYFNGSINELANIITISFVNNPSYKVIDFLSDKTTRFSFTIGWQNSWHDVLLICTHLENGIFKIVFIDAGAQTQRFIRSYAEELHKILQCLVIATNILWYEKEITAGNGNTRPW